MMTMKRAVVDAPVRHGCDYMNKAFEPNQLIAEARAALRDVDFDTVVGTGISGTIGATLVAFALNKNLLIVRKEKDMEPGANHSGFEVEGRIGRRWIFVDDMIASGATRARAKHIVEKTTEGTEFVGTYTYTGGVFRTFPYVPSEA